MSGPRVKIIAVAKDEGAYITDWVQHHLYLGFNAIDVYVNRTTDNSLDILKRINTIYPHVRGLNADWVDTCPQDAQNNLQYIIYAKAFADAKTNDEADYVLFLDIDEYWTPKSLAKSVQECILDNPDADTISIEWINEFGQDLSFQPLPQSIKGRINPLVKTLIKVTSEVEKHRFHKPELKQGKSVLVDGELFVKHHQIHEGLHEKLQHLRPVMIIHRAFRSPMEYVSLLNRGRPSDELKIKLNRGGYNECSGREVIFELNVKGYESYLDAKKKFVESLEINSLLQEAQSFVKNRYYLTLSYLPSVPWQYIPDLIKVFKGCSDTEKNSLVEAIKSSKTLPKCNNPDQLIELAKIVEKFDVHAANSIWKQALIHRPKGPKIKQKLKEYETNHV
ncbi:glycosyltransferase family 2 protein [Neptunicella marina]|uniref:Glycosyltransferase family 2 protein n=1 Tax=Neptunicella marina TaxID=2125989 RepID=A0A8J6IT33_9ALTE|nr:glycosyltransferase family 2 protein [Neptunicella marina]MBC3764923.1 glycosyltransferase family 2 protein [Neptunicella marina]